MRNRYPYKSIDTLRRPIASGASPPRFVQRSSSITVPETVYPISRRLFTIPVNGKLLDESLSGKWLIVNASAGSVSGPDGTCASMVFIRVETGHPIRISQGLVIHQPEGFNRISLQNTDTGQDWFIEILYGSHPIPAVTRATGFTEGCGPAFADSTL